MATEMLGILGVSVPTTADQRAAETLQSFAAQLGPKSGVLLGIETEERVANPAQVYSLVSQQDWAQIWLWDRTADEILSRARPKWPAGLPWPLFGGFSYGGATNRLRYLSALAAPAAPLFRVDPGCRAPADLGRALARHAAALRVGCLVVSGVYHPRCGLRSEFVPPALIDGYQALVADRTGIPVRQQITGGALFTIGPGGPPVMQFDGVPVWGSDDGFFQLITDGWRLDSETVVPRSAPGYPLDLTAYLVRVASAVVLRQLLLRVELAPAVAVAQAFLDEVSRFIAPSRQRNFDRAAARDSLNARAPGIADGFQQYSLLAEHWAAVLTHVSATPGLLEHCRVQ